MAKKFQSVSLEGETGEVTAIEAAATEFKVSDIYPDAEITSTDGSTTLFKCDYAKDFEGEKHLLQGRVYEITKDAVELLESKGFGKEVKTK